MHFATQLLVVSCVVSPTLADIQFTEVTATSGIDVFYEFIHPQSLDLATNSLPSFGGAVASGDLDRDGWTDLVFTGGPAGQDAIFFNDQNGGFVRQDLVLGPAKQLIDVARTQIGAQNGGFVQRDLVLLPAKQLTSGSTGQGGSSSFTPAEDLHFGESIALGDMDQDGLLDIYIMSLGRVGALGPGQHRLWHNEGNRRFKEIALQAGLAAASATSSDGTGSSFGDYDLDGDLDLVTAGWRPGGDGNRLFRNEGNGTFTDVTAASGMLAAGFNLGFVPSFHDMDDDRYPELIAACDYGMSRYLINNGDGTFTDHTLLSETYLDTNGMGQTIFDFDLDGMPDIYRTSIDAPLTNKTGNQLYRNTGNHTFVEVSTSQGVNAGFWGWGTLATDLDNDGYEDLAEVNGWRFFPWDTHMARLWRNDAGSGFTELSASAGFLSDSQGRGLAALDFDRDGDEDIAIARNGSSAQLFRNDLATGAGWLRVELDTNARPDLAPDGIGSRITLHSGARRFTRYVYGRNTHMGQSEFAAHFGLGTSSVVDGIEVEWCDGTTTVLAAVPANSRLVIAAP